jgi:hypothetical protein
MKGGDGATGRFKKHFIGALKIGYFLIEPLNQS